MVRSVNGTNLGWTSVDAVIIDSFNKVTYFILTMSGVVYCQSKKQHQDCIYQ